MRAWILLNKTQKSSMRAMFFFEKLDFFFHYTPISMIRGKIVKIIPHVERGFFDKIEMKAFWRVVLKTY